MVRYFLVEENGYRILESDIFSKNLFQSENKSEHKIFHIEYLEWKISKLTTRNYFFDKQSPEWNIEWKGIKEKATEVISEIIYWN